MPLGRLVSALLFKYSKPSLAREVCGIKFSSPVGMGARIDRNGEKFDVLSQLGFSFAEIGPLNPLTVRSTVRRIISSHPDCVCAVNIGKNPNNDEEQDILNDFYETLSLSYDFADMFVLDCHAQEYSRELICNIISQSMAVRLTNENYKPIFLGIGNNLNFEDIDKILESAMLSGADGIVARDMEYIDHIHQYTKGKLAVIGYKNINSPQTAVQMLAKGASLIALTEEIYDFGPAYPKRLMKFIEKSNQASND